MSQLATFLAAQHNEERHFLSVRPSVCPSVQLSVKLKLKTSLYGAIKSEDSEALDGVTRQLLKAVSDAALVICYPLVSK